MSLKSLLLETKDTNEFIDRWILFIWNNRKELSESVVSNDNSDFVIFNSNIRSKLNSKLAFEKDFLDQMFAFIERTEHIHLKNSTEFKDMDDKEFLEWTLNFFRYTIEAFESLIYRYNKPHFKNAVFGETPYDLLLSRISKFNKLYNFCRNTLLEHTNKDSKLISTSGLIKIMRIDHSLIPRNNDETYGDDSKYTGNIPEGQVNDEIIIIEEIE